MAVKSRRYCAIVSFLYWNISELDWEKEESRAFATVVFGIIEEFY